MNKQVLRSEAYFKSLKFRELLYLTIVETAQRKKIRRRLLRLPASPPAVKACNYEIHMLLHKWDFEMAVCTAMILNCLSGKSQPFVFHDNGTISKHRAAYIQKKFPGTRYICANEADSLVHEKLKNYPLCLQWREAQVVARKVIDFRLFCEAPRYACLDPDILFAKKPEEFLAALDPAACSDNLFNKDVQTEYAMRKDELESITGKPVAEKINVGLAVINASVVNFDLMEQWLDTDVFRREFRNWTLEQGLVAGLAAMDKGAAGHLGPGYDVDCFKVIQECVTKHYVMNIRHNYDFEGLIYLLDEQSFEQRWSAFLNTADYANKNSEGSNE